MVEQFRSWIDEELEETRNQSAFRDIVDWTLVDGRTYQVAEGFARFVATTDEAEHEAMVHGALFARQILHMLLADKVTIPLIEYWNEVDVDNMRQRIADDTAGYLSSREHVRSLIRDALPAIDPTGEYSESITKICAFLFMLAESNQAERHITSYFETLEPGAFSV
ncbi:MAG: hypothetical protein ABIP74_05335 [Candidatus Saccharimonas sp.]